MKRSLLFAVMFLAVVSFMQNHNGHTQSKYTIAVLDFKDVTGDSALSYLSVAVPELMRGDVRVRVVAGHAYGERSPVEVDRPTLYVDVHMPAGSEIAASTSRPVR